MVDEARVLALLRSIRADLAFLDREADADEARRSDEAWLRGIKYAFVTAIERCVDIAQHLAASESWGAPGTNADAIVLVRLADHADLDEFVVGVLRWLDEGGRPE